MTASQILSTILAAILGVLGKVCDFLVSMAFTDFAVLGSLVLPFVKVVCATIALPAKVLVWVAYFIKAFLIGLLYFVPVLLTSGVPFLGDRQCQPFPQTLEDMLKRSPCAPHATADFMTYLIDNGYATAPLKFCLWYLDFAARTVDNNYRFPLWDIVKQKYAETLFEPGTSGYRERLAVHATRLLITPWEVHNQPPVSVLRCTAQAEATAITAHLFDTFNLSNPFDRHRHNPYSKELQIVLATFFASDAPLKLADLQDNKVSALLVALQTTSHFTAFKVVYEECLSFTDEMFNQFRPQDNSIGNTEQAKYVQSSARLLGFFAFLLFGPVTLLSTFAKVSAAILIIPALLLFIGCLLWLYAKNCPCCVVHGFSRRGLRPWEAFLTNEDFFGKRKEAGLFVGIARKEALESTPWCLKYTHRVILWDNLCLSIGDMLVRKFGDFFALLFDDDFVFLFHDRLHEMFKKEVWVEEPGIRQLHSMVFYSTVLLSLLVTGFVTAFFFYCYYALVQH